MASTASAARLLANEAKNAQQLEETERSVYPTDLSTTDFTAGECETIAKQARALIRGTGIQIKYISGRHVFKIKLS